MIKFELELIKNKLREAVKSRNRAGNGIIASIIVAAIVLVAIIAIQGGISTFIKETVWGGFESYISGKLSSIFGS